MGLPGPNEPPLVVRLVAAGESPGDLGAQGECWSLPLHEGATPDGERRLRAALRVPLQRFLRAHGWLRLYAVGDTVHEEAPETT
jgi:hypothetical protein